MTFFRLFSNDVGPNRYSCLKRVCANSANDAVSVKAIDGRWLEAVRPVRLFAVVDSPEALAEYGPNGKTGSLPRESVLQQGRDRGLVGGPRRYGR
jgi:hypothetical protein